MNGKKMMKIIEQVEKLERHMPPRKEWYIPFTPIPYPDLNPPWRRPSKWWNDGLAPPKDGE